MRMLIRDALLVTLNDADDIVQGDLLIEDGQIISVGPRIDLQPDDGANTPPIDEVLDGSGFIAIPGLVNAHCHLADYLFKGTHYNRPLEIWRQYSRAARRTVRERHLYVGALMGSLELLHSGATTVLDHHYSGFAGPHMGAEHIIRGLQETGIRAGVALTLADQDFDQTVPLDGSKLSDEARREAERISTFETQQGLEDCQRFLERFRGHSPLLRPMIGPSAPQRCSDGLLLACQRMAEQFDVPMTMHVLETKTQAIQCERVYGKSAMAHLADLGLLSRRLSTPHSVWVKNDDVPLLAQLGAVPVHNPASNLRLGSGLAPVPAMVRQGVDVALGTDGATSNDMQNMFDVVRLAGLIHNLSASDYEDWLTPRQVLRMATRGGALAMGMGERIGSLEVGKRADVVLLRRASTAFRPLNDVYGQLVYCENGSSVDTVLVDGRIVIQGGRSTLVDEDALLDEVEAARRDLDLAVGEEERRTQALEPSLRAMYLDAVSQPWSR